ncbi:MAG: RHS repeat protein, partial [Thiobacillus sp.]|nr:RHS repeat protein [Thiobacillus sp.]
MTPSTRLRASLFTFLLLTGAAAQAGSLTGLFPGTGNCDPSKQTCVAPTPSPQVACGPTTGGDPCDGSGPASQGNTSGTNQGAGNPINVITGNKYQREVDLAKLPGVLGLEIVRHYNSTWQGIGQTGHGWRLSYETDLYAVGGTLQIRQADGAELIFSRDPRRPNTCAGADPGHGRIEVLATPRGDEYRWHWPDGRVLAFDHRGRLESIRMATGEFLTLQRGPRGELLKVTDPQGRSLRMHYAPPRADGFRGIVAIDSPAGRYTYGHDDDRRHAGLANLVAVGAPDGTTRRYLYEDARWPHHLTGIGLDAAGRTTRLSTYAYDGEGRGRLSVKGAPKRLDAQGHSVPGTGIEQVELAYPKGGETVLTDSLGRKTVYRHAIVGNQYRLLEVRGPGCASCGETDVRYRYDGLGRLVETAKLDARGRPFRSAGRELDRLGRVVREWAAEGGARRPLARYGYEGDAPWPSLIARPSVVPGREHTIRIAYNAYGQPVTVAETGWAPVPDGPPQAIARTTAYAYVRLNGRSLLAQVDGPLPNGPTGGPADSDVTRYAWDGQGNRPVAIDLPGGFRRTLAYDGLGRTVETVDDDGARRIATRRDYGPATQGLLEPERIRREAWLLDRGRPDPASRLSQEVMRLSHDALGRPIEQADTAGRIVRYGYDAAGRRIAVSDGRGYASRLDLDGEGQLQRAALYRPERPDQPWRAAYYWHDGLGRTTGRLLSDGRLDTWAYDASGQVAEHVDGDEIRTRYLRRADRRARLGQTPDGWLRLATPPGPDDMATDDFGQVLRRVLADHGVQTARYDAAGRLVAIRRADGSGIDYGYDAAGRLLRKTVLDGRGRPADEVRLSYAGRVLAERRDSAQTSRYAYDALGRRTGETLRFAGLARDLAVAVRYDPATGLVAARTLADGRVLRIERTGPEAGATAQSLRLQPAWAAALQDWLGAHLSKGLGAAVGRWLPGQAIADDIAVDPYDGLTGYTAGNGLATR